MARAYIGWRFQRSASGAKGSTQTAKSGVAPDCAAHVLRRVLKALFYARPVFPARALELENQSIGAHGTPTLGAAYVLLRDEWRLGHRDRELALHLMFLAWYLMIEPPHLTGLDPAQIDGTELREVFTDVHTVTVGRAETTDPEALYVVGLMAHLAPWLLGPEDEWAARSKLYRSRYRQLLPNGIDPRTFEDRGAYGSYFRGQAAATGGY